MWVFSAKECRCMYFSSSDINEIITTLDEPAHCVQRLRSCILEKYSSTGVLLCRGLTVSALREVISACNRRRNKTMRWSGSHLVLCGTNFRYLPGHCADDISLQGRQISVHSAATARQQRRRISSLQRLSTGAVGRLDSKGPLGQ